MPATISTRVATAGVIGTAVSMGGMPIFAKELTGAGMSPVAVTFHRGLVGVAVVVWVMRFTLEKRVAYAWCLAGGLGMGLGWSSYVGALDVVPVTTAAVLYMSYPVFAIGFAWLLFKEKPHPRAVAGAGVIVLAAALALGPEVNGDQAGVLLRMIAAPVSLGFAVAVVVGKVHSLKPVERAGAFAIGSTVGLGPIVLSLSPREALPQDLTGVVLVLAIGLVTGIGPQWVYSLCAPHIGAARAAIAGAMELPTMFVVGWLVLGEDFKIAQIVAGIMVVAVLLAVPSRPGPATVIVRRRRRLIPGRFYET